MIYKNDDYRAVLAMEADRTGNYGEDYDDYNEFPDCPFCGEYNPAYYYIREGECIGCSECIEKTHVI